VLIKDNVNKREPLTQANTTTAKRRMILKAVKQIMNFKK
jgi:hypothetical protein